jgi:xylulokinase
MSLLGIDIGSSQCKAVAFSSAGKILAAATHDYAPEFPAPGWAEMDPRWFWEAFCAVTRRAAGEAKADPVTALAISSHGETFFPAGAQGEPIGPAILNMDNRAIAETRWFEESLGRRRIFEITGLVVHPMFPLAKMRWLQLHQPELVARTARFMSVIDYIMHRLGISPYIDLSLASRFMALDVRARRWSEELLAAAVLTADRLPETVPAGTIAGRLSRTAAADLGLATDTPVVVGGHDQPAGALGTGATAPGMVSDSAGTYECLLAAVEKPSLDEVALSASLNSGCHVLPELYATIAYFPSGLMVKWFHDLFAGDEDEQRFYQELEARVPEGPTGLCITPHLIGTCVPSFDPRATGVIAGLTPTIDRYALYKGVLEGVACELSVVTEMLARAVGRFDAIHIYGGGARSELGVQLRAALTGCRMQLMQSREAVCLGTALLAGVASGVYADYAEAAARAVKVTGAIEPNPEWTDAYRRQAEQYRTLYPALAPFRF